LYEARGPAAGHHVDDWLPAEQELVRHYACCEVPTKTRNIEMASLKRKDNRMTLTKMILVLACLMSSTLQGQEAKLTDLMSKDLTNLPGKEGLMMIVEYPPGSVDPIHRHNAHAFVYVLEGAIVMQVRGGKEVTLTPGQTFYEGPDDVHVVGRNASKTKPAKFVLVMVKDKGAPVLIPAN
jgi:quercetin dioxygenase-like cupin family protein